MTKHVMRAKNVLVYILIALQIACAAPVQVKRQSYGRDFEQALRVGDHVLVTTDTGAQYALRVTSVEADALEGVTDDRRRYRIKFKAVRSVETGQRQQREPNQGANAVLIFALGFAVVAGAIVLLTDQLMEDAQLD